MIYRAKAVRRRGILAAALLLFVGAVWAVSHATSMIATANGEGGAFSIIFTIAFVMMVWQMVLAYHEKPYVTTPEQQAALDEYCIAVNIPVYNEDPEALVQCLRSLFMQTRKCNIVHVVDDGSKEDYSEVEAWFYDAATEVGVTGLWTRQDNAGKRHAQGATIRMTPEAHFYLTVDSDAVLDPHAVEEGMKPFADSKVQSVAGVVLAINHKKNLLVRFTDLWFVTGQLIDRSAMSTMGGVLVNSGVLALYRANLLRENLDGYLNETFFGRKVEFSDDSMLTIYALLRGKAVQQPTSFAFTLMPEKMSHHFRQQLRWMRGAFIRSWWRFRYLPLNSYSYWGHLIGWIQLMLGTTVFVALFIAQPIISGNIVPWLIVIPVLVGYGQSLRYLQFTRSDETFRSQVATVLMSPVATLWSFFVLRGLRWYAMCTCLKTGWGTRQEVEISIVLPAQRSSEIELDTFEGAVA